MNPANWAAFAVSVLVILGTLIAGLKWLIIHYLSELKPDNNGGHNLEGRIARLEARIDAIYAHLISRDTPQALDK